MLCKKVQHKCRSSGNVKKEKIGVAFYVKIEYNYKSVHENTNYLLERVSKKRLKITVDTNL